MNIKFSVVFFLLFFLLGQAIAKKTIKNDVDCRAIFTKEHAFVYFPILVNRDIWEWYKIEQTPQRPEYAWIAEPGTYKNRKFIANGVAITAYLGVLNLEKYQIEKGSLTQLLIKTEKYAYFSKKPTSDEEDRSNTEFIFGSRVRAKQMQDESSIFIYPSDTETIKEFKRSNPTHMRLRAILPSEDESYECIVKIEHMELNR
jgi:hypothetical protein